MATPPIALGPVALALLAKRHPKRKAAMTRGALEALLAAKKIARHPPALAFEAAYGALVFPDHGCGAGWQKADETAWLVGAGACLSADITYAKPGKHQLVPIVYTSNDNAYFLDGSGAAWAQDTIEDPKPVRFAKNARAMLTKILLREYAFACPDEKQLVIPGAFGRAIATALRARPIADANDDTGDTERWWNNGGAFVVERKRETCVYYGTVAERDRARQLAGIAKPPPKQAVPDGPITFDSVLLKEHASIALVYPHLPGPRADLFRAFVARFFGGEAITIGAAIAIGDGPTMRGVVTAIDTPAEGSLDSYRIQLALQGDGPLAKCFSRRTPTRVEIFMRYYGHTSFLNVFHFDVKDTTTIEALWRSTLDAWLGSPR